MASMQRSVFEFLSVTASINSINDENLAQIRSNNFTLNRNDAPNEQTLKRIAQQFGLLDDPINLQHLKICLTNEDEFDVKTKLLHTYLAQSPVANLMNIISQPSVPINQIIETELVREITCYIHIKQDRKSVEQFIDEFLFESVIKEQNDPVNRRNVCRSVTNNVTTSTLAESRTIQLTRGCVLDMFIRSQLSARGVVNTGDSLTKLQLAEPLTNEDEFDTWHFDYMRGLFDLWLIPTNTQTFPLKWSITENAEILFKIGNQSISSMNDINNGTTNDNIEGPKLPSKSQLIAYLHQIKLYFHYVLDEYFQQAGIPRPAQIDYRCVDLAFEEMRNEGFADDGLFDQMKSFFLPLTMVEQDLEVTGAQQNQLNDLISNIETALRSRKTKSTDSDLIKRNRGFIMYGPPGTGKSDIMSKVSKRIGINMVAPLMAASELNRPLVGESERIISDICMRCHRLPYLMCCVSIDEIDSLASKRTDEASHSDISRLSVLLSVIGGIKDIRNLMIFCATNQIHMVDEAFLRRMSGKFFVGLPSSHARKVILSGMKTWDSHPSMLDDLAMATTNFSGVALKALCCSIAAHCISVLRINSSYRIHYRTVLEHAHEIALQYRIMIGAETLPSLLLRNLNETRPVERWGLFNRPNSVYTGKILINLSKKKVYVEAIITHNNNVKEKIIYTETLLERETDLKQLIERLAYYGKSRNVQLLQLVDLNLLLSKSAYNEERKFEILKERVEEFSSYRRSMIVFDLDSLIGVNASEEYAALGNSTNVSLINQNVNIYIQEKFRDAYCQAPLTSGEQVDEESDKLEEKWSVIVVRESYIYRQFCSGDHQFTRPSDEIDEEEELN